jgi:RNase P subunit RPR2
MPLMGISSAIMENGMEVPQKAKNSRTICSNCPTLGYKSKRNESSILKRYLHTYVYCSSIHISYGLKSTYMPDNR